MSEDEAAYPASEASYASDQVTTPGAAVGSTAASSLKPARRRRRQPRKSTTYLFARPAPKLSTKKPLLKLIRPTLLMQLQQLSPDRRPIPVIDVYPSSLIAGNVAPPRFSKRFPRLFGIGGELGLHDTILVRSEDYQDSASLGAGGAGYESEGDDDAAGAGAGVGAGSFEHRALLAVLSPLRRGDQSEIALEDGTVWTTTPLPNGSFDFVRVDEHGYATTARWVRRLVAAKPAAAAAGALGSDDGAEPECKYTFSIIDPRTRRHPILATLTRSTLEILDRYTTVSPSTSSRYPPSRSRTQSPASHDADASNDEEMSHGEDNDGPAGPADAAAAAAAGSGVPAPSMLPNAKTRATLPVDDALKTFISVSAIWVSLQCGWGESQGAGSGAQCAPGALRHGSVSRSAATSVRFLSDLSLQSHAGEDSSDTRGRRRLSVRSTTAGAGAGGGAGGGSRTSIGSGAVRDSIDRDQSPSLSPRALTGRTPVFPRKASSTGAAYVQRRKQMQQQMSDTSDSERAAATATATTQPRRRSRAFSRLSGEFSASSLRVLSPKFQPSPSSPEVGASAAGPGCVSSDTGISPASSLRRPLRGSATVSAIGVPAASASASTPASASTVPPPALVNTPSLPRGGRSVSAYFATNPLAGTGSSGPGASSGEGSLDAGETHPSRVERGLSWQAPRPGSVIERASGSGSNSGGGGGGLRWKRLSNWFKRLGGH